jgi:hypothetical protein
MTVQVEYSSNNSGGSWWLSDADWYALERAGWDVRWQKDEANPIFRSDDGRFLGALANRATKQFNSLGEGIQEWERITGKTSTELGCGCCGPPHSFHDDKGNYYSPDPGVYGDPYGGD